MVEAMGIEPMSAAPRRYGTPCSVVVYTHKRSQRQDKFMRVLSYTTMLPRTGSYYCSSMKVIKTVIAQTQPSVRQSATAMQLGYSYLELLRLRIERVCTCSLTVYLTSTQTTLDMLQINNVPRRSQYAPRIFKDNLVSFQIVTNDCGQVKRDSNNPLSWRFSTNHQELALLLPYYSYQKRITPFPVAGYLPVAVLISQQKMH